MSLIWQQERRLQDLANQKRHIDPLVQQEKEITLLMEQEEKLHEALRQKRFLHSESLKIAALDIAHQPPPPPLIFKPRCVAQVTEPEMSAHDLSPDIQANIVSRVVKERDVCEWKEALEMGSMGNGKQIVRFLSGSCLELE